MAQQHGDEVPSQVDAANILHVLTNVHDRHTTNELRASYSSWLEEVKDRNDAAQQGFRLAQRQIDRGPLVTHFGLQMLEHFVRHKAHALATDQSQELRNYVVQLGLDVRVSDQPFIRNKVAQLWIELIKRTWALDWYDVDEQLVKLWQISNVHQQLVLTILENLSDDVFVRDDTTAVLRGKDLSSALVEIFTSTENYTGGIKVGQASLHVRYGNEGWLTRIANLLSDCANIPSSPATSQTILKCLATLRSAFNWVMTPAVVHANCLPTTCNCLTNSDPDIIMAAIDTLLALYSRNKLEEVEVQGLVYPLCQAESTNLLRQVYEWSIVGVDDIDSAKYTISKKLSWLVHSLADSVIRFPPQDRHALDSNAFLQFVTAIASHPSPIVAVSAIHSWVKLLETSSQQISSAIATCIGPILRVTSEGLFQYDQLPEDTTEAAVLFVNDEIELYPERQGFYLNYRKFCSGVIEWICITHLDEAMNFILTQVGTGLQNIVQAEADFQPAHYRKASTTALRADAQFSIIDAAFRGLGRWIGLNSTDTAQDTAEAGERLKMQGRDWSLNMLKSVIFKDPQIRHRQIKTAVELSNRIFQNDAGFALSVLEHILSAFIPPQPQFSSYSEAITELSSYGTNELRRLALHHADFFITFYDELQSKFTDLTAQLSADERLQVDLKSILFLVVQRAKAINISNRQSRLMDFLSPIFLTWKDPAMKSMFASFESFASFQGFGQVPSYLKARHAEQLEDWTMVELDDQGHRLRERMTAAFVQLPFRETRILLSISTEKLEQETAMQTVVGDLWAPMIPVILEILLRFTSYNHQLHDPLVWPNTSPEMIGVIRRVLRDRYWQSGISEGTMNDFHSRIKSSKGSLEGFASSVRGRIRNNLEQCYSIIHTLGRLGARFYSTPQIPDLLANALIRTANSLAPHHFSILLQMLPKLIEECPAEYRQTFLLPILSSLLEEMDSKLVDEWHKLDTKKQESQQDENLSDEMRDDSVLRQTTYKAVSLVASWLDPNKEQQLINKRSMTNGVHPSVDNRLPTLQEFVLSNIQIVEPLLLFCCHALAFKDTKASHQIILAIQRFIPAYISNQYLPEEQAATVREFCSSEMLKTAIGCLHDGYYADHQQHFAELIARIWLSYGSIIHVPATDSEPAHDRPAMTITVRSVLLSLSGMTESKFNHAANALMREGLMGKPRKLRAIVLSLLENVRGVRISELGKFDNRQQASKILEKYKQREALGMQGILDDAGGNIKSGDGGDQGNVDLAGVADMFG